MSQAADTRTAGGKNTSAPVDYARLYGQGVRPSAEQSEASEDTDMDADDLLDKSALYVCLNKSPTPIWSHNSLKPPLCFPALLTEQVRYGVEDLSSTGNQNKWR